jgi:hypothetical protein
MPRETAMILSSNGSPVRSWTSTPSRTTQPASLSSAIALRIFCRVQPPPMSGGVVKGSVKTRGGSWSRQGSSSSSSSAEGSPWWAIMEL